MIKTEELNLFAGNSTATNKSLVGVVKHILFEAQDTFYKVLVVKALEHDFEWAKSQITVVGNFSDIKEGGRYRFLGRLVAHPTYGEQFRVDNYQLEVATTAEGLIAYFASENFPG
ncbi:YrrC family ATP-dependent DNA helicase, partial [Ligilactobacillus agilis]